MTGTIERTGDFTPAICNTADPCSSDCSEIYDVTVTGNQMTLTPYYSNRASCGSQGSCYTGSGQVQGYSATVTFTGFTVTASQSSSDTIDIALDSDLGVTCYATYRVTSGSVLSATPFWYYYYPSTDEKKKSSSPLPIILGAVGGGLVLLVGGVVAVIMVRRRRHNASVRPSVEVLNLDLKETTTST